MRSLLVVAIVLAALLPVAPARADSEPTVTGMPNAAEAAFVRGFQADLAKRFPTPASAQRAGFIRYTNEDDTGAISYANLAWNSIDPAHPSQLWYDVHGTLLGADYSKPTTATSTTRPHVWGVQPGRWAKIDAHVHYVAIDPVSGKRLYDKYVMPAPFRKAGGDPAHPTAATLVRLGLVKHATDVQAIFLFPTIWDIPVWVKPNPDGAFANANPLVHNSMH